MVTAMIYLPCEIKSSKQKKNVVNNMSNIIYSWKRFFYYHKTSSWR